MKKSTPTQFALRVIIYCFALLLIAFGVAISVNSNLGVSPVNSLPYVVSQIIHVPMGTCVTVIFCFYILLQVIILRKDFQPVQLLQRHSRPAGSIPKTGKVHQHCTVAQKRTVPEQLNRELFFTVQAETGHKLSVPGFDFLPDITLSADAAGTHMGSQQDHQKHHDLTGIGGIKQIKVSRLQIRLRSGAAD
jgi:hypothetical protein